MLERHVKVTSSPRAKEILANWEKSVEDFWQIYPPSEASSPLVSSELEEMEGLRHSASSVDGKECFLTYETDTSSLEKDGVLG